MADINIPSGFGGGLTRFKEEYNSRLKISPTGVVIMIVAIILFTLSLRFFFPTSS